MKGKIDLKGLRLDRLAKFLEEELFVGTLKCVPGIRGFGFLEIKGKEDVIIYTSGRRVVDHESLPLLERLVEKESAEGLKEGDVIIFPRPYSTKRGFSSDRWASLNDLEHLPEDFFEKKSSAPDLNPEFPILVFEHLSYTGRKENLKEFSKGEPTRCFWGTIGDFLETHSGKADFTFLDGNLSKPVGLSRVYIFVIVGEAGNWEVIDDPRDREKSSSPKRDCLYRNAVKALQASNPEMFCNGLVPAERTTPKKEVVPEATQKTPAKRVIKKAPKPEKPQQEKPTLMVVPRQKPEPFGLGDLSKAMDDALLKKSAVS